MGAKSKLTNGKMKQKKTKNKKRRHFMIKSLYDCMEKSLNIEGEGQELDAKFKVDIDGNAWHCYTAHVSHREVSLYCKEGHATFLVDTVGFNDYITLFDYQENDN